MEKKKDYIADITDRYVYDVTRRLPAAQRPDIKKELSGLIEDMLSDRCPGGEPSDIDIDAVLRELGRPSKLAAKYRGVERHLIGPEFFDIYFLLLKIVLGAVALGITVALVVGFISSPPENVFGFIVEYIVSVLNAMLIAFAWITIIFFLVQRFASKSAILKEAEWKPEDLPAVPAKKARIEKSEPIIGIVFFVIILILFNAVPKIFGIHVFLGKQEPIYFFNMDVLKASLILINIIIGVGIIKNVFMLIYGKYTFRLASIILAANFVSLVLTFIVFLPPAIWNENLITALSAINGFEWVGESFFAWIWANIAVIFVALFTFGNIVESIKTITKTAKYKLGGTPSV